MPDAMTGGSAPGEQIAGRTDWRKFASVTVPAVAAAASVIVAMGQGVMAASFQVAGQPFTVAFEHMEGEGFQQYASVESGPGGKRYPVAPTGIRSMTARKMCQSVVVPVPATGDVVLRLTAGESQEPVRATNLVVSTETLRGEATFTDVSIGQDAGTLDEVAGDQGPDGTFGQRADRVRISHLKQRARSATSGTFRLPGLRMRVGTDVPRCD